VGDLGNLKSDNNGIVKKTFKDTKATLHSLTTIVGRAFVLHAGIDDLGLKSDQGSKTTGNAGGRVACGTIVWSNGEGWRRPQPLPQLHVTAGLPRNSFHGFHIHEFGTIGASCTQSGGHYNPHAKNHGAPEAESKHVGDLGNLKSDNNGIVKKTFKDTKATLHSLTTIVGRAFVLHAGIDDLGLKSDQGSKTTGNAGGRVACGTIVWSNGEGWRRPQPLPQLHVTAVLTECQRQRESALKFGNYAPSCDINGNFKPLQCGAGFCWCVYADGTKIANTKCDMALSALTDAKCLLHRKDSTPVVFKPLQCRAGFCWCAYSDGTKILNTKVIAALSTLTDAKCAFYRVTPPSPIDSLKPLQCGAGVCWCAYADGTKVPNTKFRPLQRKSLFPLA